MLLRTVTNFMIALGLNYYLENDTKILDIGPKLR